MARYVLRRTAQAVLSVEQAAQRLVAQGAQVLSQDARNVLVEAALDEVALRELLAGYIVTAHRYITPEP